ncbi:MAG: chemoreceptor glutamine deamidase CheD [Burkholderiales bacterium]
MSEAAALSALADNRYHDRNFDSDAVKLLPGEFYVTGEKLLLVTVLGSCIAACIRDTVTGIGGMNHFMLPESADGDSTNGSPARYGAFAMEVLINSLMKLGARRNFLEAKVFGGGAVMKELSSSNVGERNTAFAMDFLKTEGIKVVAKDVLDIFPRKVYFFPATGKVMVRKITQLKNSTIIDRERTYRARLVGTKVGGDVELFT